MSNSGGLELLDGKLLLVTNTDAPADEVMQRYKSLADIERGFRVLKSDIEIGPVYHRLPQRIRAHALICFIALILPSSTLPARKYAISLGSRFQTQTTGRGVADRPGWA